LPICQARQAAVSLCLADDGGPGDSGETRNKLDGDRSYHGRRRHGWHLRHIESETTP